MIRAVHHPAIGTADFDRAVAFYRDLIGCTLVYDDVVGGPILGRITNRAESKMRCAILKLGPTFFEIQEYLDPPSHILCDPEDRWQYHVGLSHVCFDVVDCFGEHKRLSEAGMRFISDPISFEGVANVAYGRDPDGNLIELQEMLDLSHPIAMSE